MAPSWRWFWLSTYLFCCCGQIDPSPFTPEGLLTQVTYAQQAVKQGSLSLAITAKDGVVLAAEKRIASPLLIPPSKLQKINEVVVSVSSGLSSDARYLTKKARILAQKHWFNCGEEMGLEGVTAEWSKLMVRYRSDVRGKSLAEGFAALRPQPLAELKIEAEGETNEVFIRAFGVGFLLGGIRKNSEHQKTFACCELDPSGAAIFWRARAIGGGAEQAEEILELQYREDFTVAEAKRLAVEIFFKVLNSDVQNVKSKIDLAVLKDGGSFELCGSEEIESILSTVTKGDCSRL